MKVLVTGGAGYIGSHTCVKLMEKNWEVAVVDNLSNSSEKCIDAVEEITGKSVMFYKTDLLDRSGLERIFKEHSFDAVIHFAGLKAVGESVCIPLAYYQNNITGTLTLLRVMRENNCRNIVFSSSATVYGDPPELPIKEDFPLSAANPYGRTKLMIEEILSDLHRSDPAWNIAILRYFNPVGAHESGRIGEDPAGIPNNLMPFISRVGIGRLDHVNVFGDDYNTPDGTGVRDYIHVTDLAEGHIRVLDPIFNGCGLAVYNLGTGKGASVLEMIRAFEKACGKPIPYRITERRPGDIAACWADPAKAEKELSWKAIKSLEEMCADTWRWQKNNPLGFRSKEQPVP
ncbi:MAG: UDP-glucose 4-epimerase GalE [Desulfarculaceae bacterium]|nr:UDP-glucose 4-epimerase GalE [Desulfarculaceae bacterium]